MQRAGFLAGVTFVLGAIIGTFVIAPLLHRDAPVSQASAPAVKPDDPFGAALAKGDEAMDAGRCAEAIGAYDRALAVRFDPDVATDRGVCLRQLGDRERAIVAFEFVTLKAPSHWKARYNLTAMLIELGRVDEARASFAVLKRQRPTDETLGALERALASP